MAISYPRSGRYVLSNDILHSNDGFVHTASASLTKVKEIEVTYLPLDTTLRTALSLKTTNGSYAAGARIYVNGGALGTTRSTSLTTFQTYAEDLVFNSGDLIQLYIQQVNGYDFCHSELFQVRGLFDSNDYQFDNKTV